MSDSQVEVAECKELFNRLNDKQFLDPEQDKESIKVIDDFGDHIQLGPDEGRIYVEIYDGDQGHLLDKRPKDLVEGCCHFHTKSITPLWVRCTSPESWPLIMVSLKSSTSSKKKTIKNQNSGPYY